MTGHRPLVLVTGSAGLVGRILRASLADRFELRGFDRQGAGGLDSVGDVRDIAALEQACQGAQAVVHLAADQRVDAPWPDLLEDNIVGSYSVFEAARRASVPRVVFASSNHVTGMYEPDWANETELADQPDRPGMVGSDAELRPDSLYGVSKAFGEALGRYYSERHGLRVICLRLGSVLPEDDPWLAAVRLAEQPLPVFRRFQATWLSHRDCAGLVAAALRADVRWAVVYGVSANPHRFWDLAAAERLLGFRPRDAAPLAARSISPAPGDTRSPA
jgi:nucleoside-diphosphate-sugar epimerase